MHSKQTFKCLPVLALIVFMISSFTAAGEVLDRVVAVVDGDVVTMSELDDATAMISKETVREGKNKEMSRQEALDRLIDDILLRHAMQKANVSVDDNDLARAIANVLRQNRITIEQLHADLARKGISFETYKQQLAGQIRYIKFINQIIGPQVKISDRELRDYYDRNKEKFGGHASNFETMRESVYEELYEKRSEEALKNYLLQQRQRAYIDIRL